MGAKDRREWIQAGNNEIQLMCEENPERADLVLYHDALTVFANDIVDDYQQQRDNLEATPGLLARWEENNADAEASWQGVVEELETIGPNDEDETVADIMDALQLAWEGGEV